MRRLPQEVTRTGQPVHTLEVVDRTVAEWHAYLSLQARYVAARCLAFWELNPHRSEPRHAP